jgi:hypothetical protein
MAFAAVWRWRVSSLVLAACRGGSRLTRLSGAKVGECGGARRSIRAILVS